MYRDPGEGRDAKITEKSEKARKEFWEKCEKIKKGANYNEKLLLDIANRGASEYTKVFGRIGVHPLLHLKGGKKRPRYLVDRDEVWVLYKPALWQMGGSHAAWRQSVQGTIKNTKSLAQAEEQYVGSEKAENVQEWHGLQTGLLWIPPEHADGEMKGWGFIQRLDLETDGPVIIGKTWRAMRMLQVQMKEHVNHKAYMCLVHGRVENKTQHIRRKFAELGNDQATQVMLQYDPVNDPFFDWSSSGKWPNRSIRMAESFIKPMAYYHKKEDNSDYTLVYVNILTGITHQIRITLQSLGHPLVSDDRYLPRDQAMADLKWCPRNFLVEVRADFFDLTGPYEDVARKRYTRISIENPLPKVFQNILTNKLRLVEQLDPTADLFVGPQYWAIGDQELMNAFPKDDEYRQKVMRWGQRRGIHLDALDRLLMLSKDDVDDVLNRYRPPSEMGSEQYSYWVCPVCLHWNSPHSTERSKGDADSCTGGGTITALGKVCPGKRQVDPSHEPPTGWWNYAKDPTVHLLYIVNHKWLEARRSVMKHSRPSWEKPPPEMEGTEATPEILTILQAALERKAAQGEIGIHQNDLHKYAGLEDLQLPLGGIPSDAAVQRVRLPGRGTHSQWTYTLKASRRIEWSSVFENKVKRLQGPLYVKTDTVPEAQIRKDGPPPSGSPDSTSTAAEVGAKSKAKPKGLLDDDDDILGLGPPEKRARKGDGGEEPVKKKKRQWERRESKSNPGSYYYFDLSSGETSVEQPPDFAPSSKEPDWERLKSKSSGKFYYYNHLTGESSMERPPGVELRAQAEEPMRWIRQESSSKPGEYYYFNTKSGENEVQPPRVQLPWRCLESKTKRGQFYYHNEVTGESTVDPPPTAKSAREAKTGPIRTPARATPGGTAIKNGSGDKLPANWVKKESDKYKGKFYYMNTKTNQSSWTKPSPWERLESSSQPGKFYYVNCETGETSWEKQVVGVAS